MFEEIAILQPDSYAKIQKGNSLKMHAFHKGLPYHILLMMYYDPFNNSRGSLFLKHSNCFQECT